MIWALAHVDQSLRVAFEPAGEPDQEVIARFQAAPGVTHLHPEYRPGMSRYFYLWRDHPRVSLVCLGLPLEAWQDGAFFIVGYRWIIGEFAGNRDLVGLKGLHLKMQPLAWMGGQANKQFSSGLHLLSEISEQVLDLGSKRRK